MPSEMKVNKISPASGTAITLGDSGDTFTIPSGATITNNGTQNGFGSTSASDLSSGTLPMARLSGTLPALNGSALTALNATELTSGTIPIARLGNDVIDSQHYAAASIDNEHLADDAVGVAELSATGTASSSTFLRGDNSWAAAGGGAWEHILTVDASNASSIDFDSAVASYTMSDYSYVVFMLKHVYANSSGNRLYLRFSTNDGSSYLGNYSGSYSQFDTDGTEEHGGNTAGNSYIHLTINTPSSGAGGVNYAFSGTFWHPSNQSTATRNQSIRWEGVYGDNNDDNIMIHGMSFTADTVDSGGIDAWRFHMASGNITGRISMYGVKDS